MFFYVGSFPTVSCCSVVMHGRVRTGVVVIQWSLIGHSLFSVTHSWTMTQWRYGRSIASSLAIQRDTDLDGCTLRLVHYPSSPTVTCWQAGPFEELKEIQLGWNSVEYKFNIAVPEGGGSSPAWINSGTDVKLDGDRSKEFVVCLRVTPGTGTHRVIPQLRVVSEDVHNAGDMADE